MSIEEKKEPVRVEEDGDLLIARAGTEIDLAVSKHVFAELKRRIDEGKFRIIFDLSALEFIDSTGLSVMVDLQDAAVKLGGKVVFASPGARVSRILRVTRLDRYIDQFPSLEEARASFAGAAVR